MRKIVKKTKFPYVIPFIFHTNPSCVKKTNNYIFYETITYQNCNKKITCPHLFATFLTKLDMYSKAPCDEGSSVPIHHFRPLLLFHAT